MKQGSLLAGLVAVLSLFAALKTTGQTKAAACPRLPDTVLPEIYAWFWLEGLEFQPFGYKPFIDLIASKSDFGLLTSNADICADVFRELVFLTGTATSP